MTDIREMIENYLDNVDASYIIDLHNNTLGGDTIVTRDDFDDHFDGTGYLDLIDRLDGSFDASDDYFMDSDVIMSTCTLSDFIEFDRAIDYLKDELENSDDRSDMPEGFEELFDEYVKLAKPKHTEDEIEQKLTEYVNSIDIDDIVSGINALPNTDGEYQFMNDFAEYMSDNYSYDDIVTMIVKSSMNYEFTFAGDFFAVEDGSLRSYAEWELRSLFRNCINDIPADFVNAHAPEAQNILNGIWE